MKSDASLRSQPAWGPLFGIIRELRLTWRLFRDRHVPWWAKSVPFLALAYVVWPLDILADPVLGLGQLDDAAIILLGLRLFMALCPTERVAQHQRHLDGLVPTSPAPEGQVIEGEYRVVDDDR